MHKFIALASSLVLLTWPAATIARPSGGHSYSYGRSSSGQHYTSGFSRRNGTYVQGYHATNPNRTRNDNFSTRGNVNPYTGALGTKPRDEDPR